MSPRSMNATLIHTFTEAQARQLHALYQGEWWCQGRSHDEVHRMIAGGCLLFGLSDGENGQLLAFARVLTDGVFKAFLCDVIVHPDHRGMGLGRRLMNHILEHPDVGQVRHVELYCRPDRKSYYQEFGFSDEAQKDIVLMRRMRGGTEPSPALAHPPAHS
jgi:ribosomal protein S18 acetylase RimI-like enzyme